jgi:hypothetical protein
VLPTFDRTGALGATDFTILRTPEAVEFAVPVTLLGMLDAADPDPEPVACVPAGRGEDVPVTPGERRAQVAWRGFEAAPPPPAGA